MLIGIRYSSRLKILVEFYDLERTEIQHSKIEESYMTRVRTRTKILDSLILFFESSAPSLSYESTKKYQKQLFNKKFPKNFWKVT